MKENAATPNRPHHKPAFEASSGVRAYTVALSLILMSNSSSDRLVRVLREWVTSAPTGARLPSTRELVARYEVSPVTVQKALRVLAGQGLVESRPGVGVFVRTVPLPRAQDYGWQTAALGLPQRSLPRPAAALRTTTNDVIALHAGYPDRELLPEHLLRAALARASRGATAVTSPPVAGLPELQAWFATELGQFTPAGITAPSARDVVIFPGSQSGLGAVLRALIGSGESLVIESPSYWGAILAAAQVGVHLVPIPSGPDGPNPHDLDRALTQTGARAF